VIRAFHPLWGTIQGNLHSSLDSDCSSPANVASLCPVTRQGLYVGLLPGSLAVTEGITFVFFSSAY
jgi:hypothetical protein